MKVNSGNNQYRVVRGLFFEVRMDEVIVERLLRGIWQWHAWHELSVVQVHFDLWSRNYLLSHHSLKGTWTGCYLVKSKVFLHPAKSISSVCSKYFSQRDRLGPVAIWTRGGKVNFHPFNRVPSIHPNDAWLGHKETAAQNILHFNPDHCLWWHIHSYEINSKLSRSNFHSTSLIGFVDNFALYLRHQV